MIIIFLFFLLLVPISAISDGSSYYFIFSFFGIVLFYILKYKIYLNKLIFDLFFLLFINILFLFSSINGASFELSIIKSIQFFTIVKIIFYDEGYRVDYKFIKIIFFIFILACLIIGPILMIYSSTEDSYRFRGFFFDPNYFGAICLVLIVILDFIESVNNINNSKLKLILFSFILSSLSATIISIFVIYKILTSKYFINILSRISFPLVLFILIFSPFSSFFIDFLSLTLSDLNNSSLEYIIYKTSSLNQRFNLQSSALIMLFEDLNLFLFGLGSGRTLEFLPQAVHNGYLQLIFSHGVIAYSIFCVVIFKILLMIRGKYLNNKYVLAGFFSLLLINNFLDIFYSSLLSILFLLLHCIFFEKFLSLKNMTSSVYD